MLSGLAGKAPKRGFRWTLSIALPKVRSFNDGGSRYDTLTLLNGCCDIRRRYELSRTRSSSARLPEATTCLSLRMLLDVGCGVPTSSLCIWILSYAFSASFYELHLILDIGTVF